MIFNCFGIDKLHGFMTHNVMLAVGRISCENYYSFQFLNVGSYGNEVFLHPEDVYTRISDSGSGRYSHLGQ